MPQTVSFAELKISVEKCLGHAVALCFIVGNRPIPLEDDATLQLFFRFHEGEELRIFCSKAKTKDEEDAIGNADSCSSGGGPVTDSLGWFGDFWYPYPGSGVDLPQLTDTTASEADLQLAYEKWAGPNGTVVNEVVAKCASNVGAIDLGFRRMPDVIILDKDNDQSVFGIAAIIELTDPSEGESPPGMKSEVFQRLTAYLRQIVCLTPGRFRVYGILTNHRYLVWRKAERTGTRVKCVVQRAGPFRADYLHWILDASLGELGARKWEVMIDGRRHILKKHLVSGRHSIDFEVELAAGRKIVVTYFADPKLAAKERDICRKLNGVEWVTQSVDVRLEDPHFLAVAPKGLPFNRTDRPIGKAHVMCLRRALSEMHVRGLAHNDINPSNLFYIDERRALLSSWSKVKEASPSATDYDFTLLAVAVQDLRGSVELVMFAQNGERKRGREQEREEGQGPDFDE